MSVSRDGFKQFLRDRSHTVNTINSYVSGINQVAQHSGHDLWSIYDLEILQQLIVAFDKGGSFEDIGLRGNNVVLSALKRWSEYAASLSKKNSQNTYLLTWNPDNFNEGGNSGVKIGHEVKWSCHSRKPKKGDRVYLIRLGSEPRGIIASGVVSRESFEDADWREPTKTRHYIQFLAENTRSSPAEGMLTMPALEKLKEQVGIHFKWSSQSSGIEIPFKLASAVHAAWQDQGLSYMAQVKKQPSIPLNQILFGPPGTGKTYVSIEAAVKAAEPSFVWSNRNDLKARYDELVMQGRIRFVTFHQSYSYEDFVEGLSASSTDGKISYEKKLGVFRKLVNTAREYRTTEVRKASESFTDCWQAFIKKLDESPSGVPIKTKRSQFVITEVEDNTIRFDKNQGNSVHTLALSTLQAVFVGQREVHGGLQPYYDALIAHIRDLGQQLSATEVVRQNYVLIIDEINRGSISRIFGELITLIEPSKRIGAPEALEVTLPLTGDKFGVPDNIYIIGTMNTADRSLAGLDLALRRRFTFVEMPPKPELLDGLMVEGTDIGKMLRVMNQRITAQLDRDHCIGHAYFMPLLDNPSLSLLADIFSQNILPLLQEYFFEDWLRIRWVLADQAKKDETLAFVVKDEGIDVQQLFPGVTQFKTRDCWRLNADALLQAEAYQQIYQASMTIAEQTD